VNGLITPCRPMSLEAPAGKNPITHVGKIYSVLARDIADRLVREVPEIAKAQCFMVSQIGSPVSSPAMLQVKLATREDMPVAQLRKRIEEIVADRLAHIPRLVDDRVTHSGPAQTRRLHRPAPGAGCRLCQIGPGERRPVRHSSEQPVLALPLLVCRCAPGSQFHLGLRCAAGTMPRSIQ